MTGEGRLREEWGDAAPERFTLAAARLFGDLIAMSPEDAIETVTELLDLPERDKEAFLRRLGEEA